MLRAVQSPAPSSRRTAARRRSENEATQTRSSDDGAPDRLDQRPDGAPLLHVDVQPDVRPAAQQVLQQGDRLAAADPGLGDRVPGEAGHPADRVGDPVQRPVVERQQDAVRRRVHVGLEVPVAQVHGAGEGGEGVLVPARRAAAVGEGDRAVVVEERVHARIRPRAGPQRRERSARRGSWCPGRRSRRTPGQLARVSPFVPIRERSLDTQSSRDAMVPIIRESALSTAASSPSTRRGADHGGCLMRSSRFSRGRFSRGLRATGSDAPPIARKRLVTLALGVTLVLAGLVTLTPTQSAEAATWNLVWSDEFNGSGAPNSANWNYAVGNGNNGWQLRRLGQRRVGVVPPRELHPVQRQPRDQGRVAELPDVPVRPGLVPALVPDHDGHEEVVQVRQDRSPHVVAQRERRVAGVLDARRRVRRVLDEQLQPVVDLRRHAPDQLGELWRARHHGAQELRVQRRPQSVLGHAYRPLLVERLDRGERPEHRRLGHQRERLPHIRDRVEPSPRSSGSSTGT